MEEARHSNLFLDRYAKHFTEPDSQQPFEAEHAEPQQAFKEEVKPLGEYNY